ARIAQSSALPPVADEPTFLVRDVSEGEACPTNSGFIADQDRATIVNPLPCPMIQHQGLLPLLLLSAFDAQVARELEEQQEKENKRMTEQIARDAEVARIHVEEELQGMIDRLDRTNETIVKYLQEY
nr:hypothetical protein [Tanacetum cinerariifolium]